MSFQIDYFYRWNERIVQTAESVGGTPATGAISEIVTVNLAPNRLLYSDASGKIITSTLVSSVEADALSGIDTSMTIQEQLDSKQGAVTVGDLTETVSSVLTLSGNTGAIIGSGLTIQVKQASAGQAGYLSSTDWSTFNSKVSGSLATGYILIGNGSAQAVNTASLGDIGATVGGGLAIKASVISNTHIASNAAITRTKLATGTAYRILANNITGVISENAALTAGFVIISDANGQLTISPTSALKLTYLATANSDIQVQLNELIVGKATNTLVQNPTATENGYAITWDDSAQEWALTDPVVQGIPVAGATNEVLMKVSGSDYDAAWTGLQVTHFTDISASAADINVLLGADGNGITPTIISYLGGANPVTSSVQQQISAKLGTSMSPGAMFYGSGGGVATQLSPATDGWVLTMVAGFPQWQVVVGTGTVTSIDVSGGTTGLTFSGGAITTTGTITMAGTLDANNGGTGFSAYTIGDVLYADSTSTLAKLGIGADGEVLTLAAGVPTWASASATVGDADYGDITVSGTGTVWTIDLGINKAWSGTHSFLDNSFTLLDNVDPTKILAFQLSGITAATTRTLTIPDASGTIALMGGGAALTKVDDTNVTLTLGGTPATSLLAATSLTLGWTGQLGVTRGGTGLSSTAQGDILYADASNSLVALPKSASSTRYLSNTGSSNNPAWAQVDLTNGVTGVLPIANGGTGVATGAWLLASGGTFVGHNTINQGVYSLTFTQGVNTSGSPTGLTYNGGAHTTLTASSEATDINFNLARTVNFSNGAIALQRAFRIQAPVYSHVSGSNTIAAAYTLYVDGPPTTTGGFTTITNASAAFFGGNVQVSGSVTATGVGTFNNGSVVAGSNNSFTNSSVLSTGGSRHFASTGNVTSGAGSQSFLALSTINSAGGTHVSFQSNPTITTVTNLTGFLHNPVTPNNVSGLHIAFHATSGQVVFGNTTSVTDNRLRVSGIGTTTGLTLLLENSSGDDRFGFTDAGNAFFYVAPSNDDALTQVLVRDGSTGQIKYRTDSSFGAGISGLTTNRIPYASSATTIADDAGLTYDTTLNILSATGGISTFGGFNSLSNVIGGGTNEDYFTTFGSVMSGSAAVAQAHACAPVNDGANNTIYWVEATIVVREESSNAGGVIKIGGLFKKDGSGNLTQIGATQTIQASVEDITGTLTGTFDISANQLRATQGTSSVNTFSTVSFIVTAVSNTN